MKISPTNIFTVIAALALWSCNNLPVAPDSNNLSKSDTVKAITKDSTPGTRNTLPVAKITKGDNFYPQEFLFELAGRTINADGNGHLTDGQLKKKIDIEKGFHTQRIHFYENSNQVILFFEVTDDEVAFNHVYCLNSETLQTIWKTRLQTFNLTVGQAEGEILYLGSGENAYALHVKTGKIYWETEGLYHIHGFNYFDSMALADNEIHFTGKVFSKESGEVIKTAILDKKDGKIISVK